MSTRHLLEVQKKFSDVVLTCLSLIDDVSALKTKLTNDLDAFKAEMHQYASEQIQTTQDDNKKLQQQVEHLKMELKLLKDNSQSVGAN